VNNILFAPANYLDQMERERDYDSLVDQINSLVGDSVSIDELYCQTGQVGKRLLERGHSWKGWDDDPEMLEYVMLHRGFQYVGMGGWKSLPAEQSQIVLGCFAPFSRISVEERPEFLGRLYSALQPGGIAILQKWVVKIETVLHYSYNGAKDKWVAMCAPKRSENTVHFDWHWMTTNGKGPVKHFQIEDSRTIHLPDDIMTSAHHVGFSVVNKDGWWVFKK
jgi:hypothetical protein